MDGDLSRWYTRSCITIQEHILIIGCVRLAGIQGFRLGRSFSRWVWYYLIKNLGNISAGGDGILCNGFGLRNVIILMICYGWLFPWLILICVASSKTTKGLCYAGLKCWVEHPKGGLVPMAIAVWWRSYCRNLLLVRFIYSGLGRRWLTWEPYGLFTPLE